MPRTKQVLDEKSANLQEAEARVREIKEEERKIKLRQKAQQTLKDVVELFHQEKDSATDVDSIYEISKNIFFRVNGARRVLKTA